MTTTNPPHGREIWEAVSQNTSVSWVVGLYVFLFYFLILPHIFYNDNVKSRGKMNFLGKTKDKAPRAPHCCRSCSEGHRGPSTSECYLRPSASIAPSTPTLCTPPSWHISLLNIPRSTLTHSTSELHTLVCPFFFPPPGKLKIQGLLVTGPER